MTLQATAVACLVYFADARPTVLHDLVAEPLRVKLVAEGGVLVMDLASEGGDVVHPRVASIEWLRGRLPDRGSIAP